MKILSLSPASPNASCATDNLNSVFADQDPYSTILGVNPQQTRQRQLSVLQKYRFAAEVPIEKPDTIVSVNNQTISTNGNITTLAGPPKAGKSAVIAAILAGAIAPVGSTQTDLLGLSIKPNESNKAVLHVDSEQSQYDHYKGMCRVLERATRDRTPDWFHSYSFRDLEVQARKKALSVLCEELYDKHGGIHIIILDGGQTSCWT